MMKEKIKILCYECKKCGKMVHFQSNEEYTTQCKTCKNEMKFAGEFNYNPKNGLSAIKNSNFNNKANKNNVEKNIPTKTVVECPYCHSKKTKKITTTSKILDTTIFGIFGTKRHKQWHCNDCGSDF